MANTDSKKDMERKELGILIGSGYRYRITETRTVRTGFLGLRKTKVKRQRTLTISEPTLATLDRISAVWMDIRLDEAKLTAGGAETLLAAKETVAANTCKLARAVAIATLGEDGFKVETQGSRVRRTEDKKALESLTDDILHGMTPSQVAEVANALISVCNLGDFISSTRLMSGVRTSEPIADPVE